MHLFCYVENCADWLVHSKRDVRSAAVFQVIQLANDGLVVEVAVEVLVIVLAV